MPNAASCFASIVIALLINFSFLMSFGHTAPGNFEIEARVHVVWGPQGVDLVANGHRNTLGQLSDENRRSVFIDENRGIILINGKKYFRRNMTSGDIVLLLGINGNPSSPMKESEYLTKNYVTSVFGFFKIYQAAEETSDDTLQIDYVIPTGTKYFLVQYSYIGAHSFFITVFNPLDSIFESNPQPYNPDEDKDGLSFTLEEIEELNRQIEEEEAQKAALDELGLDDDVSGENLNIEDDQMMLVACAAEHDACELEADPEDIREFMKLSSKSEAEAELKREIRARAE